MNDRHSQIVDTAAPSILYNAVYSYALHRGKVHVFVVAHQPDLCAVRAEQVNTVFDNRVHHRLVVGHRIADNAQHLGGGGLVRVRFRECASEGGVGFRRG